MTQTCALEINLWRVGIVSLIIIVIIFAKYKSVLECINNSILCQAYHANHNKGVNFDFQM